MRPCIFAVSALFTTRRGHDRAHFGVSDFSVGTSAASIHLRRRWWRRFRRRHPSCLTDCGRVVETGGVCDGGGVGGVETGGVYGGVRVEKVVAEARPQRGRKRRQRSGIHWTTRAKISTFEEKLEIRQSKSRHRHRHASSLTSSSFRDVCYILSSRYNG